MLRLLTLVFVATMLPSLHARPLWTLGLGSETRLQKEVNPDFVEMKTVPQFFARAALSPWAAQFELAHEREQTSTGGLEITAESWNLSFWGRYEFANTTRWTPFAGVGLGSYFDSVTSEFLSARDERSGERPWFALGGGVGAVFWERLLLETEVRVAFVQERKDPMASLLFRLGVQF